MTLPPSFLKEGSTGVILTLKIQPRSSQSKIIGVEGDYLKIKLQKTPVEGAANEELIDLLQEVFKIPKKNIKILRGEKSRMKWVEIQGLSPTQILARVLSPQ
jgi:hypothetical protein